MKNAIHVFHIFLISATAASSGVVYVQVCMCISVWKQDRAHRGPLSSDLAKLPFNNKSKEKCK